MIFYYLVIILTFILFTELDQLSNKNCLKYERLPINLQKEYELKSYYIMAERIFEDCYDVLLKFSIKKEVNVWKNYL